MIHLKPSKGKLLIAEPSILNDNQFNRSVVLLTEHNERGSVGFIFNKPSPYIISDFIAETDSTLRVYHGGPVSEDNLYFVHKIPELIPNSIEIANGIYWGGNFNVVVDLLNDKIISKNDIRFFLGYSGWSNNQLDEELSAFSWIIIENKFQDLFKVNHNSFWKDEMNKFGGIYKIWANAPENPSYN
ncbi:MAG: YqgE/AlgH family protein [Flavobacteriia bacterium]|nr:MAG: YqgE/AlgH family protein [Flavobacteriia bacterium]